MPKYVIKTTGGGKDVKKLTEDARGFSRTWKTFRKNAEIDPVLRKPVFKTAAMRIEY